MIRSSLVTIAVVSAGITFGLATRELASLSGVTTSAKERSSEAAASPERVPQLPPDREATAQPQESDFVSYPSPEIAFVAGPQLVAASGLNPWPWFDETAITRGLFHGPQFAEKIGERSYYDQGLVQYINYYRTGDRRFLEIARSIADTLFIVRRAQGTRTAPRSVALGGLILRALDGRPDMWPWIDEWVDHHSWNWGERRLDSPTLRYGVRDGAYALHYAALLARVHPDPQRRAHYLARATKIAKQYYVRLQYPDGSWRWTDSGTYTGMRMQPFMVGLLLEALVTVHKLTDDPAVARAITRSVENLYTVAYRADEPVRQLRGATWRGMWYAVYGGECQPEMLPNPTCGTMSLRGGSDTNSIREVRQLNATTVHAFGYAYAITGDRRFLEWGDEIFAATFGRGRGPLADEYSGLADFRAKEYNQSYRSAGRYLAYRRGAT